MSNKGPRRTRERAVLGSVLFLIVAPGTVLGLIPWWISKWKIEQMPPAFLIIRIVGALILALGILVLLDSFARFALQGIGTPAPVMPTRHLVVTGLYRYVRNPMYVALILTILGQSMILGNQRLVLYAGLVWLISHLFVLVYEEPALRKTFGDDYNQFCTNVPRWIPRPRPWKGFAG